MSSPSKNLSDRQFELLKLIVNGFVTGVATLIVGIIVYYCTTGREKKDIISTPEQKNTNEIQKYATSKPKPTIEKFKEPPLALNDRTAYIYVKIEHNNGETVLVNGQPAIYDAEYGNGNAVKLKLGEQDTIKIGVCSPISFKAEKNFNISHCQ